jgi:hypothetical protein
LAAASATVPLPSSINLNLPEIAYKIPDLEATARVVLVDNVSGAIASCLDVTFSNGWTTGFAGIAWATGGIAIAAFVASALHSFFPLSPDRAGPEWRFFTLMGFYQFVATCGMLSLEYPGLYQVFTLNVRHTVVLVSRQNSSLTQFAWSTGLIPIQPVARSIDRMRLRTGGRNITGDTFDQGALSYSFGVPRTTISNAAYSLRCARGLAPAVGTNIDATHSPVTDSPVAKASRGIAQWGALPYVTGCNRY